MTIILICGLRCLKEEANGHDTCLVYISKIGFLNPVTFVVGTHWNGLIEAIPMCPATYVPSINECV